MNDQQVGLLRHVPAALEVLGSGRIPLKLGEQTAYLEHPPAVAPDKGLKLPKAAVYGEPERVEELMTTAAREEFAANEAREEEAARRAGIANFNEGVAKLTHATEVAGVDIVETRIRADAAEAQGSSYRRERQPSPERALMSWTNSDVFASPLEDAAVGGRPHG